MTRPPHVSQGAPATDRPIILGREPVNEQGRRTVSVPSRARTIARTTRVRIDCKTGRAGPPGMSADRHRPPNLDGAVAHDAADGLFAMGARVDTGRVDVATLALPVAAVRLRPTTHDAVVGCSYPAVKRKGAVEVQIQRSVYDFEGVRSGRRRGGSGSADDRHAQFD